VIKKLTNADDVANELLLMVEESAAGLNASSREGLLKYMPSDAEFRALAESTVPYERWSGVDQFLYTVCSWPLCTEPSLGHIVFLFYKSFPGNSCPRFVTR
jgi:hypothetical protein